MILDFIIVRTYPDQWPPDIIEEFERHIRDHAEVLAQDDCFYAMRVEVEGDLWDACYEYEGLKLYLEQYGCTEMSTRPLIDGMGDPDLARRLRDLSMTTEEKTLQNHNI